MSNSEISHGYGARRQAEFERCTQRFAGQFSEWESITLDAPWSAHFTQVRAVAGLLDGVCERVKVEAADAEKDADYLAVLPELESVVLSGWRVWEFFRGKLAQRREEGFRPGLVAADELAWACRKPFAVAAKSAGIVRPKEPPLVYLSGNVSPVALSRGSSFTAESAPGMGRIDEFCAKLLQHVPVPLISLPWHEVWHAPGLTAIAHETGHIIEVDFALSDPLDEAIKAALTEADESGQFDDWQRWRPEVFADFFAVLACGPGYVGMLADVLMGTESDPAHYPPVEARMELCFQGLKIMGLADEAKRRREEWKELADPASELSAATRKCVVAVAKKLADLEVADFDGKKLADLVNFGPVRFEHVRGIAVALAEAPFPAPLADHAKRIAEAFKDAPGSPPALDPLLVAAAARLLYEQKPQLFNATAASLDFFKLMIADESGQRERTIGRRSTMSPERLEKSVQTVADELLDVARPLPTPRSKPRQ